LPAAVNIDRIRHEVEQHLLDGGVRVGGDLSGTSSGTSFSIFSRLSRTSGSDGLDAFVDEAQQCSTFSGRISNLPALDCGRSRGLPLISLQQVDGLELWTERMYALLALRQLAVQAVQQHLGETR